MRLSNLFTKTLRNIPGDETSKNAQLLIRAGYIHKTMAGVYAFLPLGLRVIRKIEDIVRKNMNEVGSQETLLNSLHPKDLWVKANNRWEAVDVLFRLVSQTKAEYALAPTNEEQVTTIAKQYILSWKDLPEYKEFLHEYSEDITQSFDRTEYRYCAHAIIYNPNTEKYLVTDNPSPTINIYHNYAVGGKIEPGKSKEQAIVREIAEETGLGADQLNKIVYLGKIRQSFWTPETGDKNSAKISMISEMFYIETESEKEGYIEDHKFDSKEYSVWRSENEVKENILPGFQWVLENYPKILLGEIKPVFPLSTYQIQVKFRDELRSKAGLMRGREFRMKDMYDFHRSSESQDAYYEMVKQQYMKIYSDMGLDAHIVRASGGAFTRFSHEFQVITDAGEDWTVCWSDGIKDNLEISKGYPGNTNKISGGQKAYRENLLENVRTVEQHAEAAGVGVDRILKSVLFITNEPKPRFVGVAIRGDLEVNEELVIQALDSGVRKAEDSELKILGTIRGRFSPISEVAAKYQQLVIWLFDESLRDARGMVSSYYSNVDVSRDLIEPTEWGYFATVKTGFLREDDPEVIAEKVVRSSEVGNIFKLGTKWTKAEALDVAYADKDNSFKHPLMGCYGIGTTRCMGVIAEVFSDEKGLRWPEPVAPFKYHLVSYFNEKDDLDIKLKVQNISRMIYSGEIEIDFEADKVVNVGVKNIQSSSSADNVLWDDRQSLNIGQKLTDAELMGCPFIVIVSKKSLENGGLEVRNRFTGEVKMIMVAT